MGTSIVMITLKMYSLAGNFSTLGKFGDAPNLEEMYLKKYILTPIARMGHPLL